MITGLIRDLKAGALQLIRRPGFAAAAVLSLALGIGVNTTLFSIVNAVLLRETVITDRDRLVEIYTGLSEDFPQLTTSYPDYLDIRAGADALAGVAASGYVRGILSGERPALVTGEAVTANYFDVLGVRLPLGRSFHEEENRVPNAAAVVIISHGLWHRRFDGQPTVIGQTLELSGLRYTVVGVAPQGFMGTLPGIPADVWVPTMMVERLVFSGVQVNADNDPGTTRLDRRGSRWLFVKGRLAAGRTVSEAQAQIAAIFARLQSQYPLTNDKVTVSVVPAASVRFHPMLDGYIRQASIVLMAAVGLVLLIACANVANLLLAQAVARRREFAIRAAIGASAGRIMRQLLSEGLVLAAAGGGLGILLAWWAGRVLAGIGTNVFPIPVSFEFTLDGTVLTFAVVASLTTALLFGLAPAWSSSRPDISGTLKGSPGRTRRPVTLGNVLVCGQLALSLVLLVSGALLARGLLAARQTDIGFDPTPVSSLQFNLQMNGYDLDRATALRNDLLRTIRALPGVVAVSTTSRLPLAPDININGIHVPGYHRADDEEGTITDTVGIGADYFAVVGIPIVAGRAFTEADIAQHRRVAILNETMARHYWPDGTALGRLIHTAGFNSEPFEIVGIARDHRVRSVGEAPRSYLHVPDSPSLGVGLIVRTTVPAASALPMLRKAVWALEPNVLFTEDVPAVQVAATTMMPTRLGAMAAGAFGALALLLAAIGLYGLVTQSVRRRTREIGIRMALGAQRGQVLRMILAQGGRLVLIGVAVGALGAAAIARVLDSLLYGISSFDPIAYGAAMGVLLLVALLANAKPALAAAAVDPVRALQNE